MVGNPNLGIAINIQTAHLEQPVIVASRTGRVSRRVKQIVVVALHLRLAGMTARRVLTQYKFRLFHRAGILLQLKLQPGTGHLQRGLLQAHIAVGVNLLPALFIDQVIRVHHPARLAQLDLAARLNPFALLCFHLLRAHKSRAFLGRRQLFESAIHLERQGFGMRQKRRSKQDRAGD